MLDYLAKKQKTLVNRGLKEKSSHENYRDLLGLRTYSLLTTSLRLKTTSRFLLPI